MWVYPIFGLAILCLLLWIGDLANRRTKGVISGLLVASLLYIAGYLSGVIPTSQPADLGLGAIISAYGMTIIVTNAGTMISMNELLKQWKTVLTALFSILFMAAVVYFIGSALFGRVMTLIAIPPISGGAVASMITADAATAAGHSDLAALAMLYNVVQMLFGVPVSSFFLRKYCQKAVASGAHLNYIESSKESEKFNIRFLKPIRNEFNTPNFILAKLAIVGFIATLLSGMTDNSVPATVIALVLGVIFTEIGFLERESLSKAGYYGFIMFAFMAMLIASFSALTLEKLISFLAPLIVLLAIGVAMLTLGATIMGVIFKMDWRLAAALGPCATFGYPFSQIISEDIVKGMDLPEEEYGKLLSMVMPKMVVSGFTTCTVASIFLASFIAPLIFN